MAPYLFFIQKIRIVSQKINQENKLRPYVDTILEKCPIEFRETNVRRFAVENDKERVTYSQLVSLHEKVMNFGHAYTRATRYRIINKLYVY